MEEDDNLPMKLKMEEDDGHTQELLKELKEKAAKIFEDKIWSNHVVTRCILGFLPTPDILCCSLVCKTWSAVSREYLRLWRPRLRKYDMSDRKRQTIGKNHPYNGMHLLIGDVIIKKDFVQRPTRFRSNLQHLAKMIKTKHFFVDFGRNLAGSFYEVNDFFLKSLLTLLPMSELKTLRINVGAPHHHYRVWAQMFHGTDPNGLSNLKVFYMDFDNFWERHLTVEDCEMILRACPNITHFYSPVTAGSALHMFNKYNKLCAIKWFYLRSSQCDADSFAYFASGDVPMEIFAIDKVGVWEPGMNHSIEGVLQSCQHSLREVKLHSKAPHDNISRLWRLSTLNSVTQVSVTYERASRTEHFDCDDTTILNHPQLKRLFPNAKITYDSYVYLDSLNMTQLGSGFNYD